MISVVIPVRNGEKTIQKTIESCLEQEIDQKVEVLVIDDGSTDRTGEIVVSLMTEDSRVRYYKMNFAHDNKARQYGAGEARGEYVIFIDSDARFVSKEEMAKLIKGLDVADVAGTGVKASPDANFWQRLDYYFCWYKATDRRKQRYVDFSPFMCVATTKDLVIKHPLRTHTATMAGNDIAWGHTMKQYGYKWYVTDACMYHIDRDKFSNVIKHAYIWGLQATMNRSNKYDRFRYFFPKNRLLAHILIPFGMIGHTMWIHYQWAMSKEFRNLLYTPLILLRNFAFHYGVARGT